MDPMPATWPTQPIEPRGWVTLAASPSVTGPWTEQVRFGLRVLDPLPSRVAAAPGSLPIATSLDPDLPDEGYRLTIAADGIDVAASTPAGAIQATTTIRQLLPAEAWRATASRRDDWRLPIVTLSDAPAWPYRGFMLDVARHFSPVPEVLRWIELAAMHRLNRLHLHLTDDQGWRIESARYPALAELASWRTGTWIGHGRYHEPTDPANVEGTPHGGSYSVADLREITAHADRHGIAIVPEIDLPGHASALIAAIPQLGVPGCPPQQVATRWGLLASTISPLPEAMEIVATLLGEAADAIDSPYLHIGGDEADLAMWRASVAVAELAGRSGGFEALRRSVNAELVRIVLGLGRRPIAWDDAFVAGGLPTEAIVMPWRSAALGATAAAAGHDVIMTPVRPTYLDYAEAMDDDEPLSIGAPQPLADVARWVPSPAPEDAPGRVLGGQAQLWAEFTPDLASREYRAFPRLTVLAANLWRGLPLGGPDGEVFASGADEAAFAAMLARLDARHVNHRPLVGPHPWQRGGTGRRAPRGVIPMAVMAAYLDAAAQHAEPPPM